jgi:hypothetical protein
MDIMGYRIRPLNGEVVQIERKYGHAMRAHTPATNRQHNSVTSVYGLVQKPARLSPSQRLSLSKNIRDGSAHIIAKSPSGNLELGNASDCPRSYTTTCRDIRRFFLQIRKQRLVAGSVMLLVAIMHMMVEVRPSEKPS